MAQYTIRSGNAPTDVFVGNGSVTNLGPGTIYYSDSQNVNAMTYEGTLAASESTSLEGVQWFITDAPRASLVVIPGETTVGQGPTGPVGPAGPSGPAGQNAVAISDAVRGETDRFYREVGGVFSYDGSAFVAKTDSFSRPTNIALVSTDAKKITVLHEDILPRGLVESHATVGENLERVGIKALVRTATDLKSSDIVLLQTRSLDDSLSNPGDGTPWVLERGAASPFIAQGLENVGADFATAALAIPDLVAGYRFEEVSGATIQDAGPGNKDGVVVGSGTTYGVAGGLPNEPSNKAMGMTGLSANEFTFNLTGAPTQAALTIVWIGKLGSDAISLFRDHTSLSGTGYFVAHSGGTPDMVQYRLGNSTATYTTTKAWADLQDGGFHVVVVRKNGVNCSLVIDGELIHTAANAGSTAIVNVWHVGRNGSNTGDSNYYELTMDELWFYGRSLDDDEIADLYNTAVNDGRLHITHEAIGSTKRSEITLTPQGALRPVLVPASVTETGFDVEFFDGAGALVEIADADMAVGVAREVRDAPVDPTHLTVETIVQKEDSWADAMVATTPVFWARLGEASGTSFNDEIGTNDGTSQATTTLGATGAVSGDADKAVTFNGIQGKIGFANPALTGPFSFEAWFKCTGAGTVGPSGFSTIIGWSTSGGPLKAILLNNATGAINAQTGGASLTTPSGLAPNNAWNHLIYTWDGTTQKIIVNGLLAASSVTANISLNAAFFLGSYLSTSTQYSFKGDMDEPALWDRALTLSESQQLYVTGSDTVLKIDRATSSGITFRALFETFAPPPTPEPDQPAPVVTALPAGDSGGAATSIASLGPYRSVLNAFYDWVGRPLPALQVDRDAIELNGLSGLPLATSDNWKNWFCLFSGIDPVTGATTGNGTSGSSTPLYMSAARYNVYVVPDDQPLRDITDMDVSVPGWATQVNAAIDGLGGLPVPADALPDSSGDRYTFVYQPGTDLIATMYAHGALQLGLVDERASTTIELTSSPSTGGFFLEFDYIDNVNKNVQTFFCQAPVPYNCTDTQLLALLQGAKTTAGVALGSLRANASPVIITGGPLNVAPLVTSWTLGAPLYPVGMRFTNNFLNAGSIHFTYENSEHWSRTRLSAVTSPSVSGGHVPIISGSRACATATRILQLPMVIDWAEYKTAYDIGIASGWDAAGTDLGHVLGMVIGNCGTGSVYPATAGDGTLTNTDGSKMKEGAFCTFPVAADSSKVAPEMMPVFNTIKRYGFIPYDKTGGGSEFVFRNWTWPGQSRPFPGPSTFKLPTPNPLIYMRQLPWHQLQIIDPAAVLAGW